jgi:gliding motility-associated-like protein
MRSIGLISLVLLCLLLVSNQSVGQVTVEHHDDLPALVQNLFVAGGVKVYNVRFLGDNEGNIRAIGSFSRGANGPNDIFSRGLILSTGNVKDAVGPNQVPNSRFIEADASHNYRQAGVGDPDLQRLVVPPTYDAAVLEFEFEAQSDSIFFRYIFASEEYTEWVNDPYNDVFAFFISGPGIVGQQNLALLPDGQAVAVNSVNHLRNTAFYIDNGYESPQRPAPHNIRYDGFTRVLVAKAQVIPCRRYRLKIAIADVEDQVIDSAVLLEAYSLKSNIDTAQVVGGLVPNTQVPTTWESCGRDLKLVYRRRNTSREVRIPLVLGGTARNQIDYRLSAYEFHFPVGVDSAVIHVNALWDALPEGTESVSVTYRPIGSCEDRTLRFNIQDANPRLALEPGQTIIRCGMPGDTVINLNARVDLLGGSFGIEWQDRRGNVVSSQPNWLFRPTSDTLLTVHATDRLCSIPVPIDTFRYRLLHFNPRIPLRLSLQDTIICRNTSVHLDPKPRNGTGNYTYAWSDGSSGSTVRIQVNQPQQVSVRVSDECQSVTQTVTIGVHQSRMRLPAERFSCKGAVIDLLPTLSSTVGWASYRWIDEVTGSVMANQPNLRSWQVDKAYTLRFEAIDSCGEVLNALYQIRLFPEPDVQLAYTVGICEGETYELQPRLSGAGLVNFRWTRLRDGAVVSQSSRLTGLASSSELFRFDFEDTCQVAVSRLVYLLVTPRSLIVGPISAVPGERVCPGSTVQLNVNAELGSGFYSYQWSTGSSEATTEVVVNGLQLYSVTVSDGCLTFTRSIRLDVFPEPVLRILQQDTTVCPQSDLQLVALISGGSGTWEPITWLAELGQQIGEGPSISRTIFRSERIWAEVVDGCNRIARDSILLGMHPDLVLDPIPDQRVCRGQSVNLELQASGTPPFSYNWIRLPDLLLVGTNPSISFLPDYSARFEVTVRDFCQTRTTGFFVDVIQPTFRLERIQIDPGTLLCVGTSVSLEAQPAGGSGDYVYQWSTGSRDSVEQFVLGSDLAVQFIASDGCQVVDTLLNFKTHPLPRVVVPDSVTMCTGEPVTLVGQATGGNGQWSRIEWLNPMGEVIGADFRLRFEPRISGFYRLFVEDGCGYSAEDSIRVALTPIAELHLPPDTFICAGQLLRIESRIAGSNSSTRFRWSPASGLDDPTRPDPTARPVLTTRYQLRAWTDGCASEPAEIEVQVRPLPLIELPSQFVLCEGRDSIDIQPQRVIANEPVTYLWSPESVFRHPDSARSRAYSAASVELGLLVRDRSGCTSSANSRFVVAEVPVLIPPSDTFFCRGDAGVQLIPQTRTASQVRLTLEPSTGVGGIDPNRPWLRPDSTTQYRLSATSLSSGCVSDPVSFWVSVFERPRVSLQGNPSICLGDTVLLHAATHTGTTLINNFNWQVEDSFFVSSSPFLIVRPRQNTSYFVFASDSLCQGPRDSLNLTVRPNPTVAIPQVAEACAGSRVEVRAEVAGSTDYRFQWMPDDRFKTPDQQQTEFLAESPSWIFVQVWGAGCHNPVVDSALVRVRQPATFGADRGNRPHRRQIFRGDTLRFAGWAETRSGVLFRWEPSQFLDNPESLTPWARPDSSTQFVLTATEGPCVQRDSLFIEVVDRVHVGLSTRQAIPVCLGDTLLLYARRNEDAIELEWYPQPLSIIFDTIGIYIPLNNETYRLIGRDNRTQVADTAWIYIEVKPRPVAAFDWALAEPCSAGVVSFLNRSLNSSYSVWSFGDGHVPVNDIDPYHTYDRTGRYHVQLWVSNGYNCVDSTADWVQIKRFSGSNYQWRSQPALPARLYLPDAQIELQVTVEEAKDWWIEWGDGFISRDQISKHRYRQAGQYAPLLVTVDSGNCRRAIALPAIDVLEPTLHLPNAFSPNGDGVNDRWQLFYQGSEQVRVRLRSRTDEIVFETNDPQAAWDGTLNQKPVPEGTYLIEVIVGSKTYRQTLQLIR